MILRTFLSTALMMMVLVGASPVMAQSDAAADEAKDGPQPQLTIVSEKEHDFGTIKQGEKVSTSFEIKNEGDAALQIKYAKGSCGCTVPKWPREEIPAGETRNIDVTFNSKGKMGRQRKSVTLRTNEPSGQNVHIMIIKGTVVKPGESDQ